MLSVSDVLEQIDALKIVQVRHNSPMQVAGQHVTQASRLIYHWYLVDVGCGLCGLHSLTRSRAGMELTTQGRIP